MTNEERDLITRFIERVGGPAASGGFGSVPATTAQNLPPIDRDADALLAELFQKYPEARYRITQVAVVQEQALAGASQRINALQAEVQRLQQAVSQGAQGGASPWNQGGGQPQPPARGFFGGLFGGGQPAAPPPQYAQPGYAQPGYAQPNYAQQGAPMGAFQPRGTGFLGGALQTAAGVAGGVLAANALTSMFSGGGHGGGLFGNEASASTAGLPEPPASESPWGGAGAADPFDQGGVAKDSPASDPFADNSAWAPAQGQDSGGQDTGWQDASGGGGDSGWQDSSGGGDSGWDDSSGDA